MLARTPYSRINDAIKSSNSFSDTLTVLQESTNNMTEIKPSSHLDIYLTTLFSSHFVYNFLNIFGEETLKPSGASLNFIKFLESALPILKNYIVSLSLKELKTLLEEHGDDADYTYILTSLNLLMARGEGTLSRLYEGLTFDVTF